MYAPDALLLASKKPRIIELVSKVDVMSINEITSLNEKQDVIRGLLIIKEFGKTKDRLSDKIANAMEKSNIAQPSKLALPCEIYQICSVDFWLKINSTELEIKTNWYWAKLENSISISNNIISISSYNLPLLLSNSKFIKTGNVFDLYELEHNRLSNLKI